MGIYAITGASSGIGAAIGRQLKAQGHYVINISRRAAAEDAADVNISADLAMKASGDGYWRRCMLRRRMDWMASCPAPALAPPSLRMSSSALTILLPEK